MNVEIPAPDAMDARREFAELVAEQAAACLWFLREPGKITLADPAAETVLEAIVHHGNRAAWQRAKRLQAWRSRNLK